MLVKILGSAAGGGFPQWNCACANCRLLRAGNFAGKARTQTQLAISGDGRTWFLLGASPDLRAQIEATPELHPRAEGDATRHSPIAGAVLLNADVDHALGLLLLRELQPLHVYATPSIHRILTKDNSMFAMLQRVPGQVTWTDYQPGSKFLLTTAAAQDSELRCQALPFGMHFPAYVSDARRSQLHPLESSLGLIVESPSGKRLAFMPAVPRFADWMLKQFESCDVLLFDGTFWNESELIDLQGSKQTAGDMGHMPVSGPGGSLALLEEVKRPRKIYVHINNTNPILNEAGPEHRQVREAGWEIAEDGWQLEI
jgi:pyrroloquinoline quinone biosynthesis protein B